MSFKIQSLNTILRVLIRFLGLKRSFLVNSLPYFEFLWQLQLWTLKDHPSLIQPSNSFKINPIKPKKSSLMKKNPQDVITFAYHSGILSHINVTTINSSSLHYRLLPPHTSAFKSTSRNYYTDEGSTKALLIKYLRQTLMRLTTVTITQ